MTDENTEETAVEDTDTDVVNSLPPAAPEPEGESSTDETEPDVFSRDYVEGLRSENAKYRQRAQAADALAQRLHTELVRATGRLADPTDLPFLEEHLDDQGRLTEAIDELLTRKPHLATRRPTGEIGQGPSPAGGTVDLAAILRGKTG